MVGGGNLAENPIHDSRRRFSSLGFGLVASLLPFVACDMPRDRASTTSEIPTHSFRWGQGTFCNDYNGKKIRIKVSVPDSNSYYLYLDQDLELNITPDPALKSDRSTWMVDCPDSQDAVAARLFATGAEDVYYWDLSNSVLVGTDFETDCSRQPLTFRFTALPPTSDYRIQIRSKGYVEAPGEDGFLISDDLARAGRFQVERVD